MDAHNGDPIDKAEASAFAAQDPAARPPCPQHKDLIDRRTSDSKGNFEFFIDSKYSSYFAVYCANGFAARPVPANDNLRSGTRVQPDPVRLYPSEARLKLTNVEPVTGARQAIARVLDDLGGNLRYYRSADGPGYARAAEGLSAGDRQTLGTLERRSTVGLGQSIPGALPQVAEAAILRILNEAGGHLRYYSAVAEGPFFAAVKLFPPDEQAAIERLRTRVTSPA